MSSIAVSRRAAAARRRPGIRASPAPMPSAQEAHSARAAWQRAARNDQHERHAKERAALKTRQDFALAAKLGDLAERERKGIAAIRDALAQAQAADTAPDGPEGRVPEGDRPGDGGRVRPAGPRRAARRAGRPGHCRPERQPSGRAQQLRRRAEPGGDGAPGTATRPRTSSCRTPPPPSGILTAWPRCRPGASRRAASSASASRSAGGAGRSRTPGLNRIVPPVSRGTFGCFLEGAVSDSRRHGTRSGFRLR